MNKSLQINITNNDYLSQALTWLRLRLIQQIQQMQQLPPSSQTVTEADLATAASAMEVALHSEPVPAFVHLSQSFNLSRFEQQILLLCLAMEFLPEITTLYGQAQNDPACPYATFRLASILFDEVSWDALSEKQPLRYWQLIQIKEIAGVPRNKSPLIVSPRIYDYLCGLNEVDDQVNQLVSLVEPLSPLIAPSQQALVEQILTYQEGSEQAIIQLLGADRASKELIAWHVTQTLSLRLYRLSADWLPTQSSDLEQLIGLWKRESKLLPLALYLDIQEIEEVPAFAKVLKRFISNCFFHIFIDSYELRPDLKQQSLELDVKKPTSLEQRSVWAEIVPDSSQIPLLLSGQFNLRLDELSQIIQKVTPLSPDEIQAKRQLWDASVTLLRPRLSRLAQRIDVKARWNDIVLPFNEIVKLRHITDYVRYRSKVYDDWSFRQRQSRGLGLLVLFAGKSGTGKTMAAEVLATDLHLPLYRIDLSTIVDKYIGETEKNLRRLFDAAEDGGAILFFDEADALFGKRSQVKDSHDRYANVQINYLLQRVESFNGIAILATNLQSDMDEAFKRRIRYIVNFPVPDHAARQNIWQKILPEEVPCEELDYSYLAHFELTGGSILNAALKACIQAAHLRRPLNMYYVLNAVRDELLKNGRLIIEKDFNWWPSRSTTPSAAKIFTSSSTPTGSPLPSSFPPSQPPNNGTA